VHKRMTLRISKGLRAVALAAGISRRVYSDTRVIFITIITIYIVLAEMIGTPLIIFSKRSMSNPKLLFRDIKFLGNYKRSIKSIKIFNFIFFISFNLL
jgi:hypothetical protein